MFSSCSQNDTLLTVSAHVHVGGRLFMSEGCMCHCEGLLVLPSNADDSQKSLLKLVRVVGHEFI